MKKTVLLTFVLLIVLLSIACTSPQQVHDKFGQEDQKDQEAVQNQDVQEEPQNHAVDTPTGYGGPKENNGEQQQYHGKALKQTPFWTPMGDCSNRGAPTLTSSPIPLHTILAVEPQGELTGSRSGHITPGDHGGFRYDEMGQGVDVYAMADGYIIRVERNKPYFMTKPTIKNYHLNIEHSCSFYVSYVHVTELDQELLLADKKLSDLDSTPESQDSNNRNILVRIPIKAGQRLGKTEGFGLLGMLAVNTDVTLKGFANPERYKDEPWKIHAVPIVDYFAEPLKSEVLEKNPRTAEPRGGKIDLDVPGTLAGNWFAQGTTGYHRQDGQAYCGEYLCPYWDAHLAFTKDYVSPDQIRISIGFDTGLEYDGPYGVQGNSPQPSDVTPSAGMIKYELVKLEDISSQFGFPEGGKPLVSKNTDKVIATLAVQMLDDATVKIELFPGVTAPQVSGFTGKARVYVR